MRIIEKTITIPAWDRDSGLLDHFGAGLGFHLKDNEIPIRLAVTDQDENHLNCEIGVITDAPSHIARRAADLFEFRKRQVESVEKFNAVLLVPTGIGAEIGGHAGDATAVARMVAESCDELVLHPNVVNASDINELPDNALYVEGSIITRLIMGAIGLQKTRANRVLVVLDDHQDAHFVTAAVNSVSASRATFGMDCPEVVCLNPPIQMWAEYSDSGSAVGRVEGLEHCLDVLERAADDYDAVALSSIIKVPYSYHADYFKSAGKMINPWGGVEAMLSHAISSILNVPTAHSPMLESLDIERIEPGIVEPRLSAEAVSTSFLQCILKGLHQSPRIVLDESLFVRADVFSVEDVSCLIIPDGCLGLPTIAALEQGIHVIAVRENTNLMRNDLTRLPWRKGQFIQVESYLEAVGAMNALKAGVSLESVCRPISATKVRKSVQAADMTNKVQAASS
ncbi:MAG: DUF3326 domain-containing protein [Alphaproteobacteria bacterium]|nr:DUF3326 domain-containing protein [Alphaproteobacteria bacterium]